MFHILTAAITLIICFYSWLRPSQLVQKVILGMTCLSLGSGVLLTLDPAHFTRAFCIKLGVYVFLIAITLYRLHTQVFSQSHE